VKRALAGLVGVVLLVGCQDSSRSNQSLSGPSFDISEARSGGNPDLFFAPPLAATPQPGDAGFEEGAANALLVPYVRVCETDGAPSSAGCRLDVTAAVTGSATGLAMSFSSASELYQVNWSTKSLDVAKDYRIEIWGIGFSTPEEKAELDARWLFGWRDIRNSPDVAACNAAAAFCNVNYGQNLPVKVRIEQYVFCPIARNCAVQFVAAGVDATLEATLPTGGATSSQLFIPGQEGTDFALAFEPCTPDQNAAVENALDIPTFGACLHTVTTFTPELTEPALISLCSELGGIDPSGLGLSPEQAEQLALHHVTEDLSQVHALPEAWRCGTPTSGGVASAGAGNRLFRLARALGDKALSWLTPRALTAAVAVIDRGGGGEVCNECWDSFFKLALPAKFERGSPAFQVQLAGSDVTLTARVTDLFGAGVANARVRWNFQPALSVDPDGCVLGVSGCAPGEVVSLTNPAGEAQATVHLSSAEGDNVVYASGRGIADDRESGCTVQSPAPGTDSRCNGPRTELPYGPYDPFIPFHEGDVFDGSPPTTAEATVEIAEGTRLPFTVHGCVQGRGTPGVNGSFADGEWQCARQYDFTANVSGGSTPATLYVMNDDTNLYLAVRLARSSSDKVNTLQFNFDNNNSWKTSGTGAAEAGDDILSLDAAKGFTDAFLTLKCVNSSQSSCWATDVSDGGTADGSGAVANDGTYTTYEIAHPLNTADDAHDYSLSVASNVGLFLTLQTGSGATGNTQWPQFRRYQEILIQP